MMAPHQLLSSYVFLLTFYLTNFASASPWVDNATSFSNAHLNSRACNPSSIVTLNTTHITIGVSAVISGENSKWEVNTNVATLLALDKINDSPDILPNVRLEALWADDASSFAHGFMSAFCLSQAGVPVVVGPTYSGATLGFGSMAGIGKVSDTSLPL